MSTRPKSIAKKRAEQAAYQREYRAKQKHSRAPSRDDIARQILHWYITEALYEEHRDRLAWMEGTIIDRLVAQGFDEAACWRVFDAIIDKYEDGWAFQRKPHLRAETD